jgi:hypothetical protein
VNLHQTLQFTTNTLILLLQLLNLTHPLITSVLILTLHQFDLAPRNTTLRLQLSIQLLQHSQLLHQCSYSTLTLHSHRWYTVVFILHHLLIWIQ